VLHGDFTACNQFDMTARLGDVSQPALVMAGSRDRMAPPAGAVALHEGLPHSELLVIEDAGHMLTFERTDQVMRAIGAFLDRISPREAPRIVET
jgi:pimeloyl-ACP methyl ester carboxylesterase